MRGVRNQLDTDSEMNLEGRVCGNQEWSRSHTSLTTVLFIDQRKDRLKKMYTYFLPSTYEIKFSAVLSALLENGYSV